MAARLKSILGDADRHSQSECDKSQHAGRQGRNTGILAIGRCRRAAPCAADLEADLTRQREQRKDEESERADAKFNDLSQKVVSYSDYAADFTISWRFITS